MANPNEDPISNLTQQVAQLLDLVQNMIIRTQVIVTNDNQDQNGRDNNQDDRVLRNVRVDAPSFDGALDPIKFLDWISEIEDYFECHGLEDDRRVGLAKMKLLGQVRTYWKNYEHYSR